MIHRVLKEGSRKLSALSHFTQFTIHNLQIAIQHNLRTSLKFHWFGAYPRSYMSLLASIYLIHFVLLKWLPWRTLCLIGNWFLRSSSHQRFGSGAWQLVHCWFDWPLKYNWNCTVLCDIRKHFNTNECQNIFVLKKYTNKCQNIFVWRKNYTNKCLNIFQSFFLYK